MFLEGLPQFQDVFLVIKVGVRGPVHSERFMRCNFLLFFFTRQPYTAQLTPPRWSLKSRLPPSDWLNRQLI